MSRALPAFLLARLISACSTSAQVGTIVALVWAMSVCGCAERNEGSIEHRWANCSDHVLTEHSRTSSTNRDSNDNGVGALGALDDKFVQSVGADEISANDSIQVTLETVFIAGFHESDSRGEIAILASVKELGTSQLDFSQSDIKNARVIYYSGDVRKSEAGRSGPQPGQLLSQAGLPIYGPVRYTGQPLAVALYVLELDDAEAASAKALLQKLAEVGGAVYAPASPVLKILEQLGASVLSGQQDDSEFRYHASFVPYKADDGHRHNYLRAGDLVIIKRGNMRRGVEPIDTTEVPWSELRLDPRDKKLYKVNASAPYRGHSYWVVNFSTAVDSLPVDIENAMHKNFSTLSAELVREAEGEISERTEGTVRITEQLATEARIDRLFAQTAGQIARIRKRTDENAALISDGKPAKPYAEQMALPPLRTLIRLAHNPKPLGEARLERLLDRLAESVPVEGATVTKGLFLEAQGDISKAREVAKTLGLTSSSTPPAVPE